MDGQTEASQQRDAFIVEALAAEQEMVASGLGYAAEDVHRYVCARIAGENPQRPDPKPWRNQVSRNVTLAPLASAGGCADGDL